MKPSASENRIALLSTALPRTSSEQGARDVEAGNPSLGWESEGPASTGPCRSLWRGLRASTSADGFSGENGMATTLCERD